MTLAEFRATHKTMWGAEFSALTGDAMYEDDDEALFHVYRDTNYIREVTPDPATGRGKYVLTYGRGEWTAMDRAALEESLFMMLQDEGEV